jgi:histidinol-phosphatase (PHP family)
MTEVLMLFDTHMHTQFSTDSKMLMDEALKRRQELGIGIVITEHLDLDYPQPKAFIFDIEEYFEAYNQYRSDEVMLGIEIGMRSDLIEENRKAVEKHPFDFVIGSIHVIEGIDIYQAEFYAGRTKREVYGQYFDAMLNCAANYDFIDSLGHIDYIARYARFEDAELRYSEFRDYIDKILEVMVEKEKAVEINTRRLNRPETVAALLPIYRRFRELGGRLVTIGSDAHTSQDIGKHFAVALDLASAAGLKPVWYKERKPQYI